MTDPTARGLIGGLHGGRPGKTCIENNRLTPILRPEGVDLCQRRFWIELLHGTRGVFGRDKSYGTATEKAWERPSCNRRRCQPHIPRARSLEPPDRVRGWAVWRQGSPSSLAEPLAQGTGAQCRARHEEVLRRPRG